MEFLQVKTLSPAHPDAGYGETKALYFAYGFRPLEEFPTLWDPANPALQLIETVASNCPPVLGVLRAGGQVHAVRDRELAAEVSVGDVGPVEHVVASGADPGRHPGHQVVERVDPFLRLERAVPDRADTPSRGGPTCRARPPARRVPMWNGTNSSPMVWVLSTEIEMSPLMGGETTSLPGSRPRPLRWRYCGSAAMRTILVVERLLHGGQRRVLGRIDTWSRCCSRPGPVVADPKLKMKAPPNGPAKPVSNAGRSPPMSCSTIALKRSPAGVRPVGNVAPSQLRVAAQPSGLVK